jgi:hypothetical protein
MKGGGGFGATRLEEVAPDFRKASGGTRLHTLVSGPLAVFIVFSGLFSPEPTGPLQRRLNDISVIV